MEQQINPAIDIVPVGKQIEMFGDFYGTDKDLMEVLPIGSGKSWACTWMAILAAMKDTQKTTIAIAGPTLVQTASIYWREGNCLKTICESHPGVMPHVDKLDSTNYIVKFKNGSQIRLVGADESKVKGQNWSLCIMDECSEYKDRAFLTEVENRLRPSPSNDFQKGRVIMISTPEGKNWFYEEYIKNKQSDDWVVRKYDAYTMGVLPKKFIDGKKDSSEFGQDYMCDFASIKDQIWDKWSSKNESLDAVYDPNLPIYVGMDFNVSPMTATLFHLKKFPCGNKGLSGFDEVHMNNSNVYEMIDELKNRYPGKKMIIIPDASSGSRSSASPIGITQLRELETAFGKENVMGE